MGQAIPVTPHLARYAHHPLPKGEGRFPLQIHSEEFRLTPQPFAGGEAHTVHEIPRRQTFSAFELKLMDFQERSQAAHHAQIPALGKKRARLMPHPSLA